ncbi:Aste57867_8859 [Aphanomyces stellatus]|uniref:Aste57867_8859 protein n=1 Tax=Aphanomyces stellatus TaxID=120398 RepID=A0A485KLI1_9STRA|nr:hypothetical protein As57867_008824 [Aphanomyces stellatus]VFT85745.1 Aste57867_8859 [Aphanomyces stellatus]
MTSSTSRESTFHRRVLQIPIVEEGAAQGPTFLYPEEHGTHESVEVPAAEVSEIRDALTKPKHLLSEWVATAICGNDIMSSVMYSAGLVVVKGGNLAPVAFALVSLVLYLFRFVYTEVVTAIPLNGGSYNLLLNTTSKRFASIAACLSTLCYLATAVVSAITACNYFKASVPDFPVIGPTIGMLGIFAVLMIVGIKESSVTAYTIFLFHMVTLTVLFGFSLVFAIKHPHILIDNFKVPYPPVDFTGHQIDGNVFTALFFGFSAAMLGVTGFETSSNFVEEQQPGVFPKTLRNMWALSSIYNVSLCVLGLGVLPIDDIVANENSVLARMALVAGGVWLQWWVSVDANCPLGRRPYVLLDPGLMRRLADDRVMPTFLASKNACRGTAHWIPISFFVLSSSFVLILNADPTVLSNVYTYSFLMLMFLFGTGCMTLKLKRHDIPQELKAPWAYCIIGVSLVFIGFVGNLLGNPMALTVFVVYFLFVAGIVFVNLNRVFVLRALIVVVNLFVTEKIKVEQDDDDDDDGHDDAPSVDAAAAPLSPPKSTKFITRTPSILERDTRQVAWLAKTIKAIRNQPIIFFAKTANMTVLNKAICTFGATKSHTTCALSMFTPLGHPTRWRRSPSSRKWSHSWTTSTPSSSRSTSSTTSSITSSITPSIRIDFYSVVAPFEPATIEWISRKYKVATNLMFIKQPSNADVHKVSAYGVRVITG